MRTEAWHGHGAFHGYWTWSLDALEPKFGDEATLRKLSDELHRRKMKLVLDVVLNHVGPDAPLLTEKPEWFHRKGGIQDWNDPVQLTTFDVHGLPDLATERRRGHGDRHAAEDVGAVALEELVFFNGDLHIQVARGAAFCTGFALPG